MDYLYKLRSAVSTVKSTVESALPGNPIGREYEIVSAVASAGPGLCWTIYDGLKRSNKQEVSVWWLDKRHIDKWPPRDRDLFMEIVKRGIQQLTRLRHPRLLVVEHSLEEAKDSLAFCTEPVCASLANVLNPPSTRAGITDEANRAASISSEAALELKKYSLEEIEIKMGFKEVVEALRFLHFDARMIHRNVRPESIIITKRSAWKLAGFEFCLASVSPPDQQPSYPNADYDTQLPSFARPQLDFCAPELPLGGRLDVASDIYSLALVFFSVFNKGKRLFEYRDDITAFRKNAENMKSMPAGKLSSLSESIRDDLKLCLQFTPELRPDASQLLLIKYFDDPNVKTLSTLESLRLMEGLEKANFFKTLPATFSSYPKKVITRRVLPALADEMRVHPQTISFVLPALLQAAELLDQGEFAKFALPTLEPIVQMERAYQAWHLVLQKVDLFLSKMPPEHSRQLLVPLACSALESDSAALHESCAQCLHKLAPLIDSESMKKRIVPRLLSLATEMNVLSVRVNALLCLGRMLDNLEKWHVTEQILPALSKIQSRDPAILMAVLGVFRLSFNCAKLGGLGRDICAKVCLPFLVTSCVEQALNARQFEAFMSLIRDMLKKVETEQRRRLEQAPGPTSNAGLDELGNHSTGAVQDSKGLNDTLAPSLANPKKENKGGALSLEDKRRLAAEQEKTLQLRQSTPLEPFTASNKASSPLANSFLGDLLTSPSSSNSPLSSVLTPRSGVLAPQNSLTTIQSNFSPLQSNVSAPQSNFSAPQSGVLAPHTSFAPLQSNMAHHNVLQSSMSTFPSQPKTTSAGDPFASLNVFSTTEQNRMPMTSSPSGPAPSLTPSASSPQFQQLPAWSSGASASPANAISSVKTPMGIIPPPPAPAPGSSVKSPPMGTGVNWTQSPSLDTSRNSRSGKNGVNTARSNAQDDLADLFG